MLRFDFSENANGKLFNTYFGDVRLDGEFSVGDDADIYLKGVHMGVARIAHIRKFPFGRLTEALSLLNCGKPLHYQAALLNRYYNNGSPLPATTVMAHIIFRFVNVNFENQYPIAEEFWVDKATSI